MKFFDILATANANLRRNKVRTVLTIIAIFVGGFTISLTLALRSGVNDYINRQVDSIGGKDTIIVAPETNADPSVPQKYDDTQTVSTMTSTGKALNNEDVAKIESNENVKKVQPVKIVALNYIQGAGDDKYQISAQPRLDGLSLDIATGNDLDQNTDEFQVALPDSYVSYLGYSSNDDAIGKTVQLGLTSAVTYQKETVSAKIVAVTNKSIMTASFGTGSTAGTMTMNQALTDSLYSFQSDNADQYAIIFATLEPGMTKSEQSDVAKTITNEGYTAMTIDEAIGMFKSFIDAMAIVLTAFGAIALLAASFGIINTLFMAVQERTKEIGLMKAMGMSSRKVFLLFSTEAILIGFWGSIIGALVAIGVGAGVNAVANQTFLTDLPGFTLMMFPWYNIAIIVAVIMLIAFLAGTLPARRAAKQNPIDALRYE